MDLARPLDRLKVYKSRKPLQQWVPITGSGFLVFVCAQKFRLRVKENQPNFVFRLFSSQPAPELFARIEF